MFKFRYLCLLCLCSCQSLQIPESFEYREIQTSYFKIAVWQKITAENEPYKIYIEGDGYAFGRNGLVSANPTPRGKLLREIAFGDKHANVVYMARPCQYTEDSFCRPQYWSTARFSDEVITSEYETLRQIILPQSKLTLVGFSGGAQVAGLLAVKYPDLNIQKLVTVAGNLDVENWTSYHRVPKLDLSDDLHNYRDEYAKFAQVHYVGADDTNIVPSITLNFIKDKSTVITIKNASHNTGWEAAYERIRAE